MGLIKGDTRSLDYSSYRDIGYYYHSNGQPNGTFELNAARACSEHDK